MRIIADGLSHTLGQQAVLINQPGAGGALAVHAVSAAAPDGYTFGIFALSDFITLPGTADNLPVILPRDFTAVGSLGGAPMFITAAPWLQIKTLPELIAMAKRENLTVRQIAGRLGGYGGLAVMGTPKMIADQMEEWLVTEASDGFNVMFPYLPGGLDDFVNKVVPELQRRGLFRTEYEGKTLRENLGLPRPENRFFSAAAKAAE